VKCPRVITETRARAGEEEGNEETRRYARGKALGRGGFATVYECTETRTGKAYACKVVSKETLAKERTRKKMQTEIRIHRAVDCAHVVKFVRCFEDETNVYIIMELCSNKTLSDVVKMRGKLTEAEAAPYLREVVAAGNHLHAMRVIHRDLKLSNLFLTERGWGEVANPDLGPGKDVTLGIGEEKRRSHLRLKIGDFGLACALENGARRKTICGTPNYIAPEVLEGSKGIGHSYEVDTWSFGVILYTLLYGAPPFQTKEIKQTYKRIRAGDYSFPSEPSVSESTKDLIRAALHPDPGHRPSFQEIARHPLLQLGASHWTLSDVKPAPYEARALTSPAPKSQKIDTFSTVRDGKGGSSAKDEEHAVGARSPLRARRNGAVEAKSPLRGLGSPTRAMAALPVLEDDGLVAAEPRLHRGSIAMSLESSDASRMALELDSLRLRSLAPPTSDLTNADFPPLWVKRWCDFTSMYGVGYVLSDGTHGVFFNDLSTFVFEGRRRVAYREAGKLAEASRLDIGTDAPQTHDMRKKLAIALSFRSKLSSAAPENDKSIKALIETSSGGLAAETSSSAVPAPSAASSDGLGAPYVKDCVRTSKGVFWRLSNRTMQANFCDGSEILVSAELRLVVRADALGRRIVLSLDDDALVRDDVLRRSMRWLKNMMTVAQARSQSLALGSPLSSLP